MTRRKLRSNKHINTSLSGDIASLIYHFYVSDDVKVILIMLTIYENDI